MNTAPTQTLIGMREVTAMTRLSRATIDRRSKDGSFPKKVPLSDSGTRQSPIGFVKEEVEAWIKNRMNSRPGDAQANNAAA